MIFFKIIIFNPIERDKTDPRAIKIHKSIKPEEEWTEYNFSIHLNKSDSKEERLEKLQKIKKYILLIRENTSKFMGYLRSHDSTHEFLFPKKINLKKYLIGLVAHNDTIKEKSIKKILKKKYKYVKIYDNGDNSGNYPTLMKVIC